MPRILQIETPLFSAAGATGVSNPVNVHNYRHIVVAVSATLNSSLTFNFQGSARATVPTFSNARAVANMWDYIHCYDYQNAVGIIGDTGVVLNNDTVANNTRQYLINTDHLEWFSMEISAFTDGALTAVLIAAND